MTFFQNVPGNLDLQPYNVYHFAALTVTLLTAILIIVFRKRLRNGKTDFTVRVAATIVAFSLEAGFHISNLVFHTDFVISLIPLDLCAMSLWLSFVLAIWKRESVFQVLYFWGIGALISLLYPDISGIGPDRMRYYHYFGVHSYIVLTIIYFVAVYGYRIRFGSFVKAVGILFPITFAVRYLDVYFYKAYQTNWMFLTAPPDISSVLDLLPKGGLAYYFSFVMIAICVFLVFYLPWGFIGAAEGRKRPGSSVSM